MVAAPKILVIEDDPDHLEIMSLLLRDAGFHVLTSTSTAQGFALARSAGPDLIVCDLHFEGHPDGITLITALRGDVRTAVIPLLVYSSFTDHYEHMLADLNVRYVRKSGVGDDLTAAVSALLSEHGKV